MLWGLDFWLAVELFKSIRYNTEMDFTCSIYSTIYSTL